MFRSVRAVPHIEIEGESDPARVSHFRGELLGTLLGAHVGFGFKPGLPPWRPHVRFRRVQTLVREGSPLVKLRNSALELVRDAAVGRMLPVLELDPVVASAWPVDALAMLGDQALKPHPARSLE